MYAKKYMVETYILQNQSNVITRLAQMQLQLDCFCHSTGRDIYQSNIPDLDLSSTNGIVSTKIYD